MRVVYSNSPYHVSHKFFANQIRNMTLRRVDNNKHVQLDSNMLVWLNVGVKTKRLLTKKYDTNKLFKYQVQ